MTKSVACRTASNLKKNNKGFSLIELIIVITIMAILTALIAPQLLRYVEQSREAKDRTIIDEVIRVSNLTLLTPGVTASGDMYYRANGTLELLNPTLGADLQTLLGGTYVRNGSYGSLTGLPPLTSKLYTTNVPRFTFTKTTTDITVVYRNDPRK
jgi:prepilin-type N-terminal cleavage/methylation domain